MKTTPKEKVTVADNEVRESYVMETPKEKVDTEHIVNIKEVRKVGHVANTLKRRRDLEGVDCNVKKLDFDEVDTPSKEGEAETETEDNNVMKNLCQQCHVDMGSMNPRQLCGKTRCLFEEWDII